MELIELKVLISFHQAALLSNHVSMTPPVVVLFEDTIKALEELLSIKVSKS